MFEASSVPWVSKFTIPNHSGTSLSMKNEEKKIRHRKASGDSQTPRYALTVVSFWLLSISLLREQEGILRAHACIRWTTIAWAHQIWWREIDNPLHQKGKLNVIKRQKMSVFGMWVLMTGLLVMAPADHHKRVTHGTRVKGSGWGYRRLIVLNPLSVVGLGTCDLATCGHWFVDTRCANFSSFFAPRPLALSAFVFMWW